MGGAITKLQKVIDNEKTETKRPVLPGEVEKTIALGEILGELGLPGPMHQRRQAHAPGSSLKAHVHKYVLANANLSARIHKIKESHMHDVTPAHMHTATKQHTHTILYAQNHRYPRIMPP